MHESCYKLYMDKNNKGGHTSLLMMAMIEGSMARSIANAYSLHIVIDLNWIFATASIMAWQWLLDIHLPHKMHFHVTKTTTGGNREEYSAN